MEKPPPTVLEFAGIFFLLVVFQLVVSAMLAPGDGGTWIGNLRFVYGCFDLFVMVRWCIVPALRHRPQPRFNLWGGASFLAASILLFVLGALFDQQFNDALSAFRRLFGSPY
ncbi:MAG: hypothetical protein K8T25_05580 [Planctomycetia bacterium]|nr:hypothetical protein [Planctomycetia bacterium]